MLPLPVHSTDWRSYDQIANDYDRVWATRFEPVARALAGMMPAGYAPVALLDIGTGTGIVPAILAETLKTLHNITGCDVSLGMLQRAKRRLANLHVVAADAAALPFQSQTFDVVTAGFVLSHLREYRRALNDVHRTLKGAGLIAASNWTSTVDEYSQAWSGCLAEAISKPEAERALNEVAPLENYFSQEGNLEAAFTESGFSVIHAAAVDLRLDLTVEQFVEDREINSGGRLGRHLLGKEKWREFRERAVNILRERFSAGIHYTRRALIVIGQKSASLPA
jgi:ubiquinone/menaquinone biosynthesis C-methylase UbiE